MDDQHSLSLDHVAGTTIGLAMALTCLVKRLGKDAAFAEDLRLMIDEVESTPTTEANSEMKAEILKTARNYLALAS